MIRATIVLTGVLAIAAPASAVPVMPGVYNLHDHPDPSSTPANRMSREIRWL